MSTQFLLPPSSLWKSDSPSNFPSFCSKSFWQKVCIVNHPPNMSGKLGFCWQQLFTSPFLWSYKAINSGSSPRDPWNGVNNLTRLFLKTAPCPALSPDVCVCHYFFFKPVLGDLRQQIRMHGFLPFTVHSCKPQLTHIIEGRLLFYSKFLIQFGAC